VGRDEERGWGGVSSVVTWFTIQIDGKSGYWPWVIVNWGRAAEVQGVARSEPFTTEDDCNAWLREQFS